MELTGLWAAFWVATCLACALVGWLVGIGTRLLYQRDQRAWLTVAQVSAAREDADGHETERVLVERELTRVDDPVETERALREMLRATREAGLAPHLALAQARRIVLHDIRVRGDF